MAILDEDKNPLPGDSRIHVKLQFFHVTKQRDWSQGIINSELGEVPCTFFLQRQRCKVSLYQDAHVPHIHTPQISLSEGKFHEYHRCSWLTHLANFYFLLIIAKSLSPLLCLFRIFDFGEMSLANLFSRPSTHLVADM